MKNKSMQEILSEEFGMNVNAHLIVAGEIELTGEHTDKLGVSLVGDENKVVYALATAMMKDKKLYEVIKDAIGFKKYCEEEVG